jgi:hypothetical protein
MNAVSGQYIQLTLWPPSGQVSALPDTAFIPGAGPFSLDKKHKRGEWRKCKICEKIFFCQQFRTNKGHIYCDARCMGIDRRGEKSKWWKGGITAKHEEIRKTPEYQAWRKNVFKRDNYTCQYCKIKGKKIHAHHIKSFALFRKLRFVIENGITLCIDCHKKTKSFSKNV